MKKLSSAIFFLFLLYGTASPQSCLPDGITFTTQEQIDNFQTNYPGCTEIEGNVKIEGDDITNLNGLNVLTAFWGDLEILFNYSLSSLVGLENVTSIGGRLWIYNNAALTSFTGLDNVTSIGGDLIIDYNTALTSLSGLGNVTSVGGDLEIYFNAALTGLTGLDNVTFIGEGLNICFNDALTSLMGLDNLDAGSIGYLSIFNNTSLTNCEVQSICDYLVSPNGFVRIYNNAIGCNNPPEVANACGITLSCLPYGNYYFFTQSEIDDFQIDYANCTQLEGLVRISGNNISNLNGLSVVTSFGGDLEIQENSSLTSLSGMDNVNSIGGKLEIRYNDALANLIGIDNVNSIGGNLGINSNDALTSLTGLENVISIGGLLGINSNDALTGLTGLENVTFIGESLNINFNAALTSLTGLQNVTSIGGYLQIGGNNALTSISGLDNVISIGGILRIEGNAALTSLSGFDNVTSIGGLLSIGMNAALTSLTGLDNIDAASINSLFINDNTSLSICEVQSICDYLVSPSGAIMVYNNAPGCNSQQEVEEACAVSVESINPENEISIFPNPTNRQLTISIKDEATIEEVIIYNQTGQIVLLEKPANNIIDISKLQPGMYIIEVVSGQRKVRGKLVIEF